MGTSPHSGHYVCHIRDDLNDRWIIYNDNKVSYKTTDFFKIKDNVDPFI